jgi:hypothetical protein
MQSRVSYTSANTMKMVQRNLLKPFQEWGRGIKENDEVGDFNYGIL